MEDPFENLKILSKTEKPSNKNKTLLEVGLHRVRTSSKMMRMRNVPFSFEAYILLRVRCPQHTLENSTGSCIFQ
jgi:hypothetical protein